VIVVDYAEVAASQARIRGIYGQIESALADLATRVDQLTELWEGAAAEGFQATVRSWRQSAADLQERLAQLHNMVGQAHDNQASVVASNVRVWSAGRR
jgi:WXG100 family type VII secretion target